jgi:AbrB family looped-hinge helix DNA binding protein
MEQGNMPIIGKCFGSTVVGPRGQLVIPAEARRELGIDAGTRLLVFGHFSGRGFVFIKVDAVEEFLNIASRHLDEFSKFVRESKVADMKTEDEDNRG